MAGPSSAPPFKTRSYDPDEVREKIRGTVTVLACLVFLIVVVVYLVFAARSGDTQWDHIKDAMQAILPAVTSVLGTVLGFYFGSQKN